MVSYFPVEVCCAPGSGVIVLNVGGDLRHSGTVDGDGDGDREETLDRERDLRAGDSSLSSLS